MKISQFTQHDLDLFREECNFTDIESRCFEMKARDDSDVAISMELNVCLSTVAVTMRKVRSKITEVLKRHKPYMESSPLYGCGRSCMGNISHTMAEWAKIPDFLSAKGAIYIYSDYRTENGVSVQRIKIGDGVRSISELPFATMSITDEDMESWDGGYDPGEPVTISKEVGEYIFPSDGYLMLVFTGDGVEHAEARICGASGKAFFTLSKHTDRDNQSKEVFVRRGMKCEYVSASSGAKIMFVPLV